MAEAKKKKSPFTFLKNVIDTDGGIKSAVTVNITTGTVISLVGAATAIIIIAHLAKNAFKNKQMERTNNLLVEIKEGLKQ